MPSPSTFSSYSLFSFILFYFITYTFSFKIDLKNIQNNEYEIIDIDQPKLATIIHKPSHRLFSQTFEKGTSSSSDQEYSRTSKSSSSIENQAEYKGTTTTDQATATETATPKVYNYDFQALGYNFSMQIIQNTGLFSSNYREYKFTPNGYLIEKETSITTLEQIKDPCYYHGYILGEEVSNVAVSLCEGGLQGVIQAYGTDFVIVTKSSLIEDSHDELIIDSKNNDDNPHDKVGAKRAKKHVIFPYKALSEPAHQCGNIPGKDLESKKLNSFVTSLPQPAKERHAQHLQSSNGNSNNKGSSSGTTTSTTVTKATAQYIELLAINDFARFSLLGSATESSTAEIANIADSYYQSSNLSPPVRLVLTAQVTFENGDPYGHTQTSIGVDVIDLLTNRFLPWASNVYKSYPSLAEHDSHVLISGLQFQTPIVGLAPVGGMCINTDSGAITSALGFSNPTSASTLAHEIGHTLGMQHDDYVNPPCPYGYIMSSAGNPADPAKTFSSCSQTYYAQWQTGSGQHCLDNIPSSSWSPSVCGNGLIEGSEQCDCGKSKYNPNNCCNCSTCRLNNLSTIVVQCSDQQICCSGCRFISSSTRKLCRASQSNVCDSPEYCNGNSGACPKDVYSAPGASCSDGFGDSGSCFRGGCFAWSTRCKTLNTSNKACSTQTYDNNMICQKQYCTNQTLPSGVCFAVPVNPANQSDGYAQNGIPCGNGQQCFAGQCLDSYLLWSGLDPSNPSFFQRLEGLSIDEILFYGAIAMGVFFVLSCAYRCLCQKRKSASSRQARKPLASQQHGNNILYASDATSEGSMDPFLPEDPRLPPGWHAYRTSDGRPYWYNSQRAETSWVVPVF